MKIAMIGQKGIPSRAGGIEVHVEQLAKRLVTNGCDINVYCRKGYCEDSMDENMIRVKVKFTPYIKSKHLDAITSTFTATIHALFSKCDVFHYHALGPSTLSFIPRIFGKKVICTVHGLDWQRAKWGVLATAYLKFGEYAAARFSNKTINVSRNLVKYFKDKYDVDTVFIPNGVEKPNRLEPDIIEQKYGLKKEEYILFLARLVPEKGVHYLIEAYKTLDTTKKLVIAGGSSHSNQYEKEIHQLVGYNPNILFTGFVNGNELEELYSNAYLYVLPSDIEGFPISLLEAMSYGNYCLTSDITENADVIEELGGTFKKSDIRDLALKLTFLLSQPNLVREVKEKSSQFIMEKYNWNEITKKTLEVYKNLYDDADLWRSTHE
jgi:glycosyltransferase involved in cell wall biosynthesis